MQQKDLMSQIIQNKLITLNVNIYFNQLSKFWWEAKKILYYDKKPYIPDIFQLDLLEKNHDDSLVRYFGIKKILEFFSYKYY